MKKIFNLLILVGFVYSAKAQVFQNEWIDYNKTYYKFKIGSFGPDAVGAPIRRGVVRITQPALAASGLGNIPAEQFQLWRDGEEVCIYISKTSGILSSSDYIEFIGEIANGKPDRQLYNDTSYQLSDIWNLQSDSAAYFLTVNSAANNKRYVTVANNVASVTIAPEKNFMFTTFRYYRTFVNNGRYVRREGDKALYLSAYDRGEGFTSRPVHNNNSSLGNLQLPQTFYPLYLDTTGPPMTARFAMVGNTLNKDVKILLNADSLIQFPMGFFLPKKLTVSGIPASRLKKDSVTFWIQNLSNVVDDELRVATIELEYPRVFNFGGGAAFRFFIEGSGQGRYLKIANFNRGTADAVLYDVTNGKRYIANTDIPDSLRFLLDPSPSQEKYYLFLVRGDGSTAKFIDAFQQKHYTNFTQQANQGNYLIITNPILYGTGPDNYIQQYSDYRSSDTGGHYNTKVVDIHDLEDQFAYGISMHPLAIKNFLRFAGTNFTEQPKYVFLIGKGISYPAYRDPNLGHSETEPLTQQLNLVPVFGYPGSDNLLSSDFNSDIAATPIGRLSAVTPGEVGAYLEKIKEYEAAQRDTSTSIEGRLWMKKVLQLTGASDPRAGYTIDTAQAKFSKIISDSLFGANVSTFSKTADPSTYPQALFQFTKEYNQGSALLEYFGHSSSSSIDFSLDNPANYDNEGKYPAFIVNGCMAGNVFDYDLNRFNNRSTLSEKFVLEPKRGAIAYLSTSSFSAIDYLPIFVDQFYKSISLRQYGNGMGNIVKDGITYAMNFLGNDDIGRTHAQQFTLHGDPALKLNSFSAPDYAIDSSEMLSSPDYLTVAADSFTVKIKIYNLGRATSDSVHVFIVRKFPNGNSINIFTGNLPPINSVDSVVLRLPIVANRDKGTTIITATIDDNNLVPELSEKNNTASIQVKISAADLLPVFPYNYAIVNTNSVDLSASTSYAFDSLAQYVMEMDTTALFNSPEKISRQYVSKGGLITFTNIPLSLNNTVYYWRVSEDSIDKHWSSFSFTHRDGGNNGFEQAHFYQHTQSSFNRVTLDSTTRAFNFGHVYNNLFIQHSIYPTSGDEDNQFSVAVNGTIITWSACVGSSIIFNIFNPLTLEPVLNTTLPYNAGSVCDPMRRYNFEYSTQSASSRKNAMDFLDNFVPNGYYVVARKIYDQGNADWAPSVWAKDTSLYGHNNSLYHRLKNQGTQIDSFSYPRTFIFVFKKNDSVNYKPVSVLSKGLYDRISTSQNIAVNDTIGTATSPLFGPGKAWNKVKWYGAAENHNNITHLDVITIDKNGRDSIWTTIDTSQHELDISSVNASQYPYIQLRMRTQDPITVKPYQLQDWRVEFEPVPEGAIASNLGSNIPDTLKFNHAIHVAFDTLKGYVIFKNISAAPFDPLKIKLVLYDENNVAYTFSLPRTKALARGDTTYISFLVNVTDLPEGTYNLYLDINPDNDQPEQYHYNNFLYHYVIIKRAAILPVHLLDFTAKTLNNNVQLQWTVTNEINVANYEVESSSNGRTFNTIGTVAATNIKALEKKYEFIHNSPINGRNYYRIKMIDKDGKYAYSPTRVVIIGRDDVLVYPNPFHDRLNIIVSSTAFVPVTVRVSDVTGKQLLKQTFRTSTSLNLKHLATGLYVVQVFDGVSIKSFKVYKQ